MAKTRKKYEPPIAYDMSGASSGDVHAQVCKSGASPGQAQCTVGSVAQGTCQTGSLAGGLCKSGTTAGILCSGGMLPKK